MLNNQRETQKRGGEKWQMRRRFRYLEEEDTHKAVVVRVDTLLVGKDYRN
jgi:hypothetical protein